MPSVFVDTSAFFALLNRDDEHHVAAARVWRGMRSQATPPTLLTSDLVAVETLALLQARIGLDYAREFFDDFLPVATVVWSNESVFTRGARSLFAANRRKLSLVDCISFEIMRQLEVETAFTFDRHFRDEGFDVLKA